MNKKIFIAIIVVLAAVMATSTYFIASHYLDASKQSEIYEELVEKVESVDDAEVETNEAEEETGILSEYADLYLENDDMVGWIKIDDTKINYPVMQSVDEANFYLKHGFDRNYTDYGCPYVQENCDVTTPSDNIIIYAHNMKNGTMFSALTEYKSKSFWEEHKTITFDTLTSHNEYEVVAAFTTVVYTDSADSFKYYQFVQADTEDDFNDYVEKCKELSLYDTGVSAEYGDKLITLSTCEYSHTNGRMVVVAKLIQ